MVSFRFLNPRMVDKYPMYMEDVCYHGIGGEPDVLCSDLPPNRMRFLGWWYLTPERHFREFMGFLVVGVILVALLGPKVASKYTPSPIANRNSLTPRLWMKFSSLLLYPYVAYTKLSWHGSNYPGRWLLFVGMPVGTLWMLSALFCFSVFSYGRRGGNGNQRRGSDDFRYKVRFWLLETWFSFLPLIVDLIPPLFIGAVFSAKQYANGKISRGGQDGDNATITYFFHSLFLLLVPIYYFWIGELSFQPATRNISIGRLWTLVADCALRQLVGTAICAIYYMGMITPASIVAGLNVNFLLQGARHEGPNFRLSCVATWFYHGCAIRMSLGAAKIAMETIRGQAPPDGEGDDNIEINNSDAYAIGLGTDRGTIRRRVAEKQNPPNHDQSISLVNREEESRASESKSLSKMPILCIKQTIQGPVQSRGDNNDDIESNNNDAYVSHLGMDRDTMRRRVGEKQNPPYRNQSISLLVSREENSKASESKSLSKMPTFRIKQTIRGTVQSHGDNNNDIESNNNDAYVSRLELNRNTMRRRFLRHKILPIVINQSR